MMLARSVLDLPWRFHKCTRIIAFERAESRSTTAEEERNYPSRQSTIVCLLSAVIGNDMISHI